MIINANELRIGNLVDTAYGIKPVYGILGEQVYQDDNKYINCGGIKPIPLTPEWLERAGFEYYKKQLCNPGVFYEDYRLQNLVVIIKDNFIEIEYVRNGLDIEERTHIANHIKYVHQLQNLYHALTGKELEFK